MIYFHQKVFFIVLAVIIVTAFYLNHLPKNVCVAHVNNKIYRCSFGGSGVSVNKKEGDKATPVGDFPLRKVFYRADRMDANALHTQLPVISLQKDMGWCDDVNSPYYNQQISTPFSASHEALWRDDSVYDVIVIVGYNDAPVVKGKGSAIFLHIARAGYTPTAGCVAFSKKDLLEILQQVSDKARIKIESSGQVYIYN